MLICPNQFNKRKNTPKIDGLFIGGGFPEIYAKQIEKNKSLINSVRKFINDGFPVYAECGGLMYLTKSIKHNKKEFKMAGVLPAKTIMNKETCWKRTSKSSISKESSLGL